MSYRRILLAGALALASTVLLPGQTKTKNWSVPRTPDGKPDLQGVWTNATLTPMERPASVAGKPTLTDAEATAWEQHSAD
ncbi:MAG: hypothetical protein M3O35_07740, partial [Acidobacteriota bacterium]|nr:hypothetical protein [Acidobacteriota bacterium]